MIDIHAFCPEIVAKIEAHRRFWEGSGPSLIFIPRGETALYDMSDYPTRFESPERMLAFEAERARALLDWPTDGIPTVRPSLGTIFIPAIAGQEYQVVADQMPWPGKRLSLEQIRCISIETVRDTGMYRRAQEFYRLAHDERDFASYHADTQGVFDIAHILYGEEIFIEMAMEENHGWIREILDTCLGLFTAVTDELKTNIDEGPTEMIHGHGTPQGLYFPNAGARVSEDSATLLSPVMIKEFLGPVIRKCMEPYGGAFLHYCGRHEFLFEWLCRMDLVRAIDLGNPEMYDLDLLAGVAAETDTVLYTRVAPLEGETWETYLRRIAGVICSHGTRCVLRPLVFPSDRHECRAMLDLWHELTDS